MTLGTVGQVFSSLVSMIISQPLNDKVRLRPYDRSPSVFLQTFSFITSSTNDSEFLRSAALLFSDIFPFHHHPDSHSHNNAQEDSD